MGPDGKLLNPFLEIPSEFGPRVERADPISGDYFKSGSGGGINRIDYGKMVDGDLSTAFGTTSTDYRVAGIYGIHGGGASLNLMGFYHINRLIFQPRPTLPVTAIANYFVVYGDPTTVNSVLATLEVKKILVPVTWEHTDPVKDLHFDPPVLLGRIDVASLDSDLDYKETAEVGLFGEGFPSDASFTSEIIDIGTPTPRARRYSQLLELFDDAGEVEAEFPDRPGSTVNWAKSAGGGAKRVPLAMSASSFAPATRPTRTSTPAIAVPTRSTLAARTVGHSTPFPGSSCAKAAFPRPNFATMNSVQIWAATVRGAGVFGRLPSASRTG